MEERDLWNRPGGKRRVKENEEQKKIGKMIKQCGERRGERK